MENEIDNAEDRDKREEISDRKLVREILGGSSEAFKTLHSRYYARIYRLALLRCRNSTDAEDVASETFIRALTHLSAYRFQSESIYPWLSRIVTNLAIDITRRRQVLNPISLDSQNAEGIRNYLENIPGSNEDPYQLAIHAETQAYLREAVSELPGDQEEAILLRYGGDLSIKEIAASMKRSESAVKSLLHRGLQGLRKKLIIETGDTNSLELLRQKNILEQNHSHVSGKIYGENDF